MGCASVPLTAADIDYFQPPIIATVAPEHPITNYSLYNNTIKVNLAPMRPLIPAYNNKGNLLASWTPHPQGIANRPTIVIMHGGHGLIPGDFATAVWARDQLGANTLVLDSYWSRGQNENWVTYTRLGANARTLDAIAAGKWLFRQGIDPKKLILMGGSQGGWAVLRTFTNEPFITEQASGLYRAGISLYPVCNSKGWRDDPALGPYWGPVLVFTAGKDTATPPERCPTRVFSAATAWTHYPEATHGWDASNRGAHTPSVDGECGKALNVLNHFAVCRSDAATNDMHAKIKAFINGLE
ncbi:MAG: dienelactone hydrolase [Alcaligenaceae bacterium]|nr:MAG: dienelactone hydrolase [Alcaligenaceae bacterium]